MAGHISPHRTGLLTLICFAALGCGNSEPPHQPSASAATSSAAALTAADRTHTGQAAYYAAEVARYREIAKRERELSAAYARWTPPARATKDWNAILKASADARAATLEQIAARTQTFADFHTSEAAKEVGR